MGSGPRKAEVMIVGEAPGAREDEKHRAFVGPAGQLLDEVLEEASLSREDCYVTNVAKCRPPDNRTPERSEIKTCVSGYFWEEVDRVKPDFILLLGNSALRGVVGRSGITKYRGTVYEVPFGGGGGGATVLPTFHPAAVLRNPRLGLELRADVQRLSRMVRGVDSEVRTRVFLIRSTEQLKKLRAKLMEAEEIAYDLETTGLQEWKSDARIVTLGVSWNEGSGAVVPLFHSASPWRDPDLALRYLKPAFERGDCKYIAHNGKFDARWLARNGVFVRQSSDTMLAAHILEENRSKGLKPLSQVILGADAYDIGEDVRDAYNVPIKRLATYNAKDCDYTLRLYHHFRSQLKEEPRTARVYQKLMMPASNVLTKVELRGIYADRQRLKTRYAQCLEIRNRLMRYMWRYLPREKRPYTRLANNEEGFNFNSPQQIADWFFNDLGLPILEETAKGAPSTRESTLLQLAKKHPAPRALLKYRKWSKYESTYLSPWLFEEVDDRSRIHTTYKLFGTVTGRLSSSDPALQNVPRNTFIRGILGAPPGWTFVEADYSQIELRIAAMLARENRMLRKFLAGTDIHLATAVSITGKRPQDITPEERKMAKAVNFGFLYGMGWRKFIVYALDNYDVEVTDGEARGFRNRFFEEYPAFKPWHDRQRRLAQRYGRVQSPLGRVRHLPDMQSANENVKAESERQAINSPVQSFASDLMLLSLVRLDALLPSRAAFIVGTVHDSLLFQVKNKALQSVVPIIRETMEDPTEVKKKFGVDLTVPIEVEIKAGQHWSEGEVIT